MSTPAALPLHDCEPERDAFRAEVLDGLRQTEKLLPCKYFYDERGSQLFEEICALEEYYPTRTEIGIMQTDAEDMARLLGPECVLIEFGCGSLLKTRILLDHLDRPAMFVPVDISKEHLLASAKDLAAAYPHIPIHPVCADFKQEFDLPVPEGGRKRRVVYFPGSTIGNFHRDEALTFFHRVRDLVGADGALLIGVDLKKDPALLEAAYNDARGVTAEFNLNLLVHINRELDADFDVEAFSHKSVYNAERGRIEMHLVSDAAQTASINGEEFHFAAGESIRTECSYKYTVDEFAAFAREGGFTVDTVWTDPRRLFSVQYLVVQP